MKPSLDEINIRNWKMAMKLPLLTRHGLFFDIQGQEKQTDLHSNIAFSNSSERGISQLFIFVSSELQALNMLSSYLSDAKATPKGL